MNKRKTPGKGTREEEQRIKVQNAQWGALKGKNMKTKDPNPSPITSCMKQVMQKDG